MFRVVGETGPALRRGSPHWRETGDRHGTTLVVANTGLVAIGIARIVAQTMAVIPRQTSNRRNPVGRPSARAPSRRVWVPPVTCPRSSLIHKENLAC